MAWTKAEILELMADTIEEMSQIVEARHNEHMAEITSETELVITMSPRIEERYTAFHLVYFAETAAT
jgi:peptidyl-tRNA hydrolase